MILQYTKPTVLALMLIQWGNFDDELTAADTLNTFTEDLVCAYCPGTEMVDWMADDSEY